MASIGKMGCLGKDPEFLRLKHRKLLKKINYQSEIEDGNMQSGGIQTHLRSYQTID